MLLKGPGDPLILSVVKSVLDKVWTRILEALASNPLTRTKTEFSELL